MRIERGGKTSDESDGSEYEERIRDRWIRSLAQHGGENGDLKLYQNNIGDCITKPLARGPISETKERNSQLRIFGL
jgi:hypothetical protein